MNVLNFIDWKLFGVILCYIQLAEWGVSVFLSRLVRSTTGSVCIVGTSLGCGWKRPPDMEGSCEYEGVSKSFRIGRLERELQMVQLSATRCSCIAILWVSLVTFAAITLCVASQRVFIVVSIYFVIDSVRNLLVTPSFIDKALLRLGG
jgi:hypothetical protein